MKIAIPTSDGTTVAPVFGRAEQFAILDIDTGTTTVFENEGMASEHGAGTGAASFLADKGVNVVWAPEVGPKAAAGLKAASIVIKTAPAGTPITDIMKKEQA